MKTYPWNWLEHIDCENSSYGSEYFYKTGYEGRKSSENLRNGYNIINNAGNTGNYGRNMYAYRNAGKTPYNASGNAVNRISQNTDRQKKKSSRRRKTHNRVFWLIAILLIVSLTLIGGYFSYVYALNSSASSGVKVVVPDDPKVSFDFEIPLGSSTKDIANLLAKKNIIKYPLFFKILSMYNGYDGTYQAGVHPLEKGVDYNNLKGYDRLMNILSGKPRDNPTVDVTIPEGKMYTEIEDILAKANLINRETFNQVAENENYDYKFLKNIPQRPHRLEGYLFPETYKFDVKPTEKAIIKMMLDQFDKVIVPEYYDRASQLKMSMDNIIVLASIIEREAKVNEERPIIASVFYNRLKSKAPLNRLQSCATLQYIIFNRTGVIKDTLTLDDEKIDDPYNTYMYPGLPPGPICSPGLASIEAALYPDATGYYYFVAKDDGSGTHYFSKTYKEQQTAMAQAKKNREALKK